MKEIKNMRLLTIIICQCVFNSKKMEKEGERKALKSRNQQDTDCLANLEMCPIGPPSTPGCDISHSASLPTSNLLPFSFSN